MFRDFVRGWIVVAATALSCAGVFAQEEKGATVCSNATTDVALIPTMLRFEVRFVCDGKTLAAALVKLKGRRDATVEKMKSLGANPDSIILGRLDATPCDAPGATPAYDPTPFSPGVPSLPPPGYQPGASSARAGNPSAGSFEPAQRLLDPRGQSRERASRPIVAAGLSVRAGSRFLLHAHARSNVVARWTVHGAVRPCPRRRARDRRIQAVAGLPVKSYDARIAAYAAMAGTCYTGAAGYRNVGTGIQRRSDIGPRRQRPGPRDARHDVDLRRLAARGRWPGGNSAGDGKAEKAGWRRRPGRGFADDLLHPCNQSANNRWTRIWIWGAGLPACRRAVSIPRVRSGAARPAVALRGPDFARPARGRHSRGLRQGQDHGRRTGQGGRRATRSHRADQFLHGRWDFSSRRRGKRNIVCGPQRAPLPSSGDRSVPAADRALMLLSFRTRNYVTRADCTKRPQQLS